MIRLILLSICFFQLFSTGCRSPVHATIETRSKASGSLKENDWLKTELYFGLSSPAGEVTEQQWEKFVASELTPRFPDGLTIIAAYGQWKDPLGKVKHESSRLVILLHPHDTENEQRIEDLRRVYCQQFKQQSVLRVTSIATVSFATETNTFKGKTLLVR